MQAAQRYLAAVRNGQSNGSLNYEPESAKSGGKKERAPFRPDTSTTFHQDITLDGLGETNLRNTGSPTSTRDEPNNSASCEEPSYMKALRRGSMSRAESQNVLKDSLSRYSDYVDPHDDSRIQKMKDTIHNSMHGRAPKPQQRFGRRSSLGSTASTKGNSSHRRVGDCENSASNLDGSIHSSYHRRGSIGSSRSVCRRGSLDSSMGGSHRRLSIGSATSTDISMALPRRSASGSLLELSTMEVSLQRNDLSFNMSTATMPATNLPRTDDEKRRQNEHKLDQIVESLVWFSFHTPRTVLEDLIRHEMDVWKSKQRREIKSGKKEVIGGKPLLGHLPDEDSQHSVSSMSEEDPSRLMTSKSLLGNFSKTLQIVQNKKGKAGMIELPKAVERESALLFVDMSGFTRLSTILDAESLSRVINSYFDMILSEVILHGGDILKFAGDAFFAEWKVLKEDEDDENSSNASARSNALADLNASLASINEMAWDEDDDVPKLSNCVQAAAKCATAIVDKFSDYQVTQPGVPEAMLNVHCGIGVGNLVGLHVSDYKEGQEEDSEETRREFLILGEAIDQVSKAADVATDGEVMASPEAIMSLAFCCNITKEQRDSMEPVCIASRGNSYISFDHQHGEVVPSALQPYESLRIHCKALSPQAMARLHLQMALYVHPVIRANELSMSVAIQAGSIAKPTEALESRHRQEAELRSVYTVFIAPIISPRVTGRPEVDQELYQNLANIMNVTCRELDRYSGHLRQFIVDDKGVVLLATFGLRGSTFPNMVANNALPATFSIRNALRNELNVESRIGATFGKVYCGTVGGLRRHEFAVMGAPVNLAARLMGSNVNRGILVDEAVKEQAGNRFEFKSLPPVTAKGYDKPVPILEPLHAINSIRKKKSSYPFVGRQQERTKLLSLVSSICSRETQRGMVFLMGESGMGKTALTSVIVDQIKRKCSLEEQLLVVAKASSTETEQRNPLSTFRKILLTVIWDRCKFEQSSPRLNETSESSHSSKFSTMDKMEPVHEAMPNALKATSKRRLKASHTQKKPNEKRIHDGTENMPNRLGKVVGISAIQASSMSSRGGNNKVKRKDPLSQSLHTATKDSLHRSLMSQSLHRPTPRTVVEDETEASYETDPAKISDEAPYFEKLCWACEVLDYPLEYADIVGSQFLALEGASLTTDIDGHTPSMDELVAFLVNVFVCITSHADVGVILFDNFQWVDSFSWKIFQELGEKGENLLLIASMRSHDKQALRRLSTAASRKPQMTNNVTEVVLSSFETEDIRSIASHILGFTKDQISDEICSDIFQRSGGLPVFVVQVLENIKRAKTLELVDNQVAWTAAGLREKRALGSNKGGDVMEETFLSRFDGLHAHIRKVLQTCAVLGITFSVGDVLQVHPEIDISDVEQALTIAADEMILVEQESEDQGKLKTDFDDSTETFLETNTLDLKTQRQFEFSHAMWRKCVLTTMLKERKIELHRLIAEAMEENQCKVLEECDISGLLTLFDHWKSCGDFLKTAPLALAIGSRLEEWDLSAQSLELYMDALDMSFDSVDTHEELEAMSDEWVNVSAGPEVLDAILRLHIRIGLCHQRLGDEWESIATFEDAHKILESSSRIPGMSKVLKMPILSSLCVLRLERDSQSEESKALQVEFLGHFIEEANKEGNPVHIGRAHSLQAMHHAKQGQLALAIESVKTLQSCYDIHENSFDMTTEYGRDFALECFSESVQWMYLLEQHTEAEARADMIISDYLGLIDPFDGESMMAILLPVLNIFKLIERAKDADWLLKRYIINPAHDQGFHCDFWIPLFNPLAYLLEVMVMEDAESYDDQLVSELCEWVLNDENTEDFDIDLEYKAFTLLGELCWRLANFLDENPELQNQLNDKARDLLTPVVNYPHGEIFLRNTAHALLKAL